MTTLTLQIAFGIGIILLLLSGLLILGNVLPTAAIALAITAANSYLAILTAFMPDTMEVLFAILGFFFVIEGYVATYKLAKWLYKKIPGIS